MKETMVSGINRVKRNLMVQKNYIIKNKKRVADVLPNKSFEKSRKTNKTNENERKRIRKKRDEIQTEPHKQAVCLFVTVKDKQGLRQRFEASSVKGLKGVVLVHRIPQGRHLLAGRLLEVQLVRGGRGGGPREVTKGEEGGTVGGGGGAIRVRRVCMMNGI